MCKFGWHLEMYEFPEKLKRILETEKGQSVSIWDRLPHFSLQINGEGPAVSTGDQVISGLNLGPKLWVSTWDRPTLVSNGDRYVWSQIETGELGLTLRPLGFSLKWRPRIRSQMETGEIWSQTETAGLWSQLETAGLWSQLETDTVWSQLETALFKPGLQIW